jgi:single-strand DNA-binding protein
MSINSVNIIGNITKDLELRYTPSGGKAVVNFTLAVSDRFNKETTHFLDVVVWGKLAELCAEYLSKGKKAGVTGRLQTRTYENQEGKKVKVTEINADEVEFLTPKGGSKPESDDKWAHLEKEVSLDDVQLVDEADEDPIPF